MDRPPMIPGPLWYSAAPGPQALVIALVRQNDALQRRVVDLEARLDMNFTDSSRPPTFRAGVARDPSGWKRRGKFGHGRHRWAWVPPEQATMSSTTSLWPSRGDVVTTTGFRPIHCRLERCIAPSFVSAGLRAIEGATTQGTATHPSVRN